MKKIIGTLFAVILIGALCATSAHSQATPDFTFDEFGNGFGPNGPIQGVLALDPISGMTTLSYTIPNVNFVAGDFQIFESLNGPLSDVIRFEPNVNLLVTNVFFFSDNSDPDDTAPADVGIPTGVYNPNNQEQIPSGIESGTEGNNFVIYTPLPDPTPGESGFGGGTYKFVSDGVAVPEPATWISLGLGSVLLVLYQRRSKRA